MARNDAAANVLGRDKKITCFKCGKEIIMERDFWDAMRKLPKDLEVLHICGAILFKQP